MEDELHRSTRQDGRQAVIVLDASALLVLLLKESGHEQVAAHLGSAIISTVNLSEVLARLTKNGIEPAEGSVLVSELGLGIIAFDERHAIVAAGLREKGRLRGLSFADCACMALALDQALPVLTADRIWKSAGAGIAINFVR